MAAGLQQRALSWDYPLPVFIQSVEAATPDLIFVLGSPSAVGTLPLNADGQDILRTNAVGIDVRTGRRITQIVTQLDLEFRNTPNADLLAMRSGYVWASQAGDQCQTYLVTVPEDGTFVLGTANTLAEGLAQDFAFDVWEVPLDGSAPIKLVQQPFATGIVTAATDYTVDADGAIALDVTKAGCTLVIKTTETGVTQLERTDSLVGRVSVCLPIRLTDGSVFMTEIDSATVNPVDLLPGGAETVTVTFYPEVTEFGSCGLGIRQYITDDIYPDLCSLS